MIKESRNPFSVFLNFDSKITPDKYGLPATFLFGEEMVKVVHIIRARTETGRRRNEIRRIQMDVLTHKGKYRIIRDEVKNKWTVEGKLKE